MPKRIKVRRSVRATHDELCRLVNSAESRAKEMCDILISLRAAVTRREDGTILARKLIGSTMAMEREADLICHVTAALRPPVWTGAPRPPAVPVTACIVKQRGTRKPGGRWGSGEHHH